MPDIPGLGPTVYVGSYDGNFYAFNAQSGAIRWTHAAGGKISGSATIVGDVVYFSDLGTKTTAGLDVRTGHQVFSFPDGAFNPVIADDRRDLPDRLRRPLPDAAEAPAQASATTASGPSQADRSGSSSATALAQARENE